MFSRKKPPPLPGAQVIVIERKSSSGCSTILILLVLVVVAIGAFNAVMMDQIGDDYSPDVPLEKSEPAPTPENWSYSHSDYTMGKGRVHRATAQSENTVNFGFPYAGAQRGTLIIRTHPKYGKDVVLTIERGQFLVRSYENSIARVRFDDGDQVTYKVVGAEDHSTTSVFFRDYHGFIEKMLHAKRLRISIPVYQQGSPVFEFNVDDFVTDEYLEK
jgi:hypothetical protein